jgi:hypothetical protein
VRINFSKNKKLSFFLKGFFLFGFFLISVDIAYAIDTYLPLETITIGEFIYNDE